MGMDLNRREFLRAGAVLGAATVLPTALHGAASRRVTPAEFKRRLRGPIVSIPTPFTADFRVDGTGLRRMIEMNLRNQIVIFELTAGDSQYAFLAYDEIKQLARMVAEDVGNRGMSIIGTGPWWTERTIDFAGHVESVGGTGSPSA